MFLRLFPVLLYSSLILWLTGCAGQSPSHHYENTQLDPADSLIITQKVYDVRYLNISGLEHVKVDQHLMGRVTDYNTLHGVSAKKAFVITFLKDAFALNDRVVFAAANRLSDAEIADYFSAVSKAQGGEWDANDDDLAQDVKGDETDRQRFVRGYRRHAEKEFAEELEKFMVLQDEVDIDEYWLYLIGNIEESILTRDRAKRLWSTAPLVPVVYSWIWYIALVEDREAYEPDFKQRTVYSPDNPLEVADSFETMSDWELLRYYAPVFVQGNEPHPRPLYAQRVDRFGEVWMTGENREEAIPKIDTKKPTVYAYLEEKETRGGKTKQLVYARWYPEHPPMRNIDPESGPIDGWTLRISLNEANRPLLVETVASCGCYYKVFPSARLESWSGEEYGKKVEGKKFSLEKNKPYNIDVVIPELINFAGSQSQKIVAYYGAGNHHLKTIRPQEAMVAEDLTAPQESYRLASYDELENLDFQGYKIKMFDENGLVRKAHRAECTLLAPSGLFHAGHPRQRGTHLIYFDQEPFDADNLFDLYMRMPEDVFRRLFK